METLFVYGTLKKKQSNNFLLSEARFIGEGKTLQRYGLYAAGIPYVIKDEAISQIRGEIYQLDARTMAVVDSLEGHPNLYRREKVKVVLNKIRPEVINAWLYFYPHLQGILIPSGEY